MSFSWVANQFVENEFVSLTMYIWNKVLMETCKYSNQWYYPIFTFTTMLKLETRQLENAKLALSHHEKYH